MYNSLTYAKDDSKFSKHSVQENTEFRRSGSSCDVNAVYSAMHRSPEFISQIIAERKKQTDTSAHLIHVNPKFLELKHHHSVGDYSPNKQALCVDPKPNFQYVSPGILQGKLLGQNHNLIGSQSCFPRNLGLHCELGSRDTTNKSSKTLDSKNKIAGSSDKDIVGIKSITDHKVQISNTHLSKSVHINRSFTHPHSVSVGEARVCQAKNILQNLHVKSCGEKVTKSIHINPRFSHSLDAVKSYKLKNSNCDKCAVQVNPPLTCIQAKHTRMYINPKFTLLKQHNNKEQSVSHLSTQLLNTKLGLDVSPPVLKDTQQDSRVTCISNDVHEQNSESRNLKMSLVHADETSASKNSLIHLSKRKLIRHNVDCAVQRTCEEQQTVILSNRNRKLVKSLPCKNSKNVEQQLGIKPSPRLLPLPTPIKVIRSVRTKYKFVRNLSTSDKQMQLVQGIKNLHSPSLKLQKCNSGAICSSKGSSEVKLTENVCGHGKTPNRNSLVLLSKTKLIRCDAKSAVRKNSRDSHTVTISNNARKLVRRRNSSLNLSSRPARSFNHSSTVKLSARILPVTTSVKVAKSVRTKYKYIRNFPNQKNKRMAPAVSYWSNRSHYGRKYNINRRLSQSSRVVKKIRAYPVKFKGMQWHQTTRIGSRPYIKRATSQRLFARKQSNGSLVWRSVNHMQPKLVTGISMKSQQIKRRCRNSTSKYNRGITNMVRIGGVLYRRSVNKLTRTNSVGENNNVAEAATSKAEAKGGKILYIRGSKFLMEPTGKTMRRIDSLPSRNLRDRRQKVESSITRVDIGGVTFLQKSRNVLIRTDYHRARNILSQAKQRSIATLMQKMKKNNQPCIFYQRFGKCFRKDKGCCQRIHDPKQIAVCKKFLQGQCQVAGCTLSHDIVPEKMATCRFFLEGICVRDNCPYLHVKLNSRAGICIGFLQGYCVKGAKCQKRHINVCPEFDKLGKCSRGKFCPYPHKVGLKPRVKKRVRPESVYCARSEDVSENSVVQRYYENPSMCKPNGVADIEVVGGKGASPQRSPDDSSVLELPVEDEKVVSKRRKLEPMPDYIAFR